MKLNLGCGSNLLPGYLNVDKCIPNKNWEFHFTLFDLEASSFGTSESDVYPLRTWPWETSSIEAVRFIHSLEHMGKDPKAFQHIITELYRVCQPNAEIFIAVPGPRHDDFINDPTHVRPITPEIFALFSKRLNREWQEKGYSNSQLGLAWGVDFEILSCEGVLDPEVQKSLEAVPEDARNQQIHQLTKALNNVVKEYHITLRVVK